VNFSKTIDICLATYNGAPWVQEFLCSLDTQTYANWHLIVSDDASKDGTLKLIKAHFIDTPEKLTVVQRPHTGAGVVQNFQDAINSANSEYVLLADQDDVWVPEKLATLLALMRQTEKDATAPALVFSDLEVVDEHLNTLNKSWWLYTSIKPDWALSFKAMLSQNVVPGCAVMLNRSLLKMAMPIPKGVIMHDWWFLLVCLAFGNVAFSPARLIRYRRHAGAHTYTHRGGIVSALCRQYQGIEAVRKDYRKTVIQAEAFEQLFGVKMDTLDNGRVKRQALHDYIEASKKGWWQKRWMCMKNGIHLISVLQTTKFYLWI
jgi:glycosyltransferase involved in cell wall biosynthesis